LVSLLVLSVAALQVPVASADAGSATYQYFLGVSPVEGPDVAAAANGETIEVTGSGTLSIHPKSVSGGGSFTHKDANDNVIGSGAWQAVELLSFDGYGCGFQGDPSICGGRAIIRVHLVVNSSGPEFDGILQVNCLVGSPPAGVNEGVRLAIPGVANFYREVSGETVFVLQ
jgi:hypothetical protein